jgi:hypothetical protein
MHTVANLKRRVQARLKRLFKIPIKCIEADKYQDYKQIERKYTRKIIAQL